jgi:hypothetical protein
MAINRIQSGAIIIAGSGMCTGGRIRHHFKQRIWDANNTILFVGFQAAGTLGRLLVDGMRRIRLFREDYEVKAQIETLGGLSAHAGQRGLIDWVSAFDHVTAVVLVHGEPRAQDALAALHAGTGARGGSPVPRRQPVVLGCRQSMFDRTTGSCIRSWQRTAICSAAWVCAAAIAPQCRAALVYSRARDRCAGPSRSSRRGRGITAGGCGAVAEFLKTGARLLRGSTSALWACWCHSCTCT